MRHPRKTLALLLAALMLLAGCGKKQTGEAASAVSGGNAPVSSNQAEASASACGSAAVSTEEAAGAGESESAPSAFLDLPCTLQDGSLEVTALFQYSGMNPDCGDEMGENIGSLAVTNRSAQLLTQAEITARLTSGTELTFLARDIPAGETVWLFDVNNTPMADGDSCRTLSCDARFSDESAFPNGVNIITSETTVTVLNQSGAALSGLSASCHCRFDDVLFGGIAYVYPLDAIPSGGSVQFEATECYLGEAAVVRVGPQS